MAQPSDVHDQTNATVLTLTIGNRQPVILHSVEECNNAMIRLGLTDLKDYLATNVFPFAQRRSYKATSVRAGCTVATCRLYESDNGKFFDVPLIDITYTQARAISDCLKRGRQPITCVHSLGLLMLNKFEHEPVWEVFLSVRNMAPSR